MEKHNFKPLKPQKDAIKAKRGEKMNNKETKSAKKLTKNSDSLSVSSKVKSSKYESENFKLIDSYDEEYVLNRLKLVNRE